jgi:hypothetical protein
MTRLAQYTTNLLANLEKETEQPNDFIQNGPISVADNKERMLELFRGASMVKVIGLAPGFRKIRWNYIISVFWQMNRLHKPEGTKWLMRPTQDEIFQAKPGMFLN